MNNNPHTELDRLITALKNHLTAVTNRNGEHNPAIDEAYVEIANAFETYENALFEEHNEVTPLAVYGDDDDEDLEELLTNDDNTFTPEDDIDYE